MGTGFFYWRSTAKGEGRQNLDQNSACRILKRFVFRIVNLFLKVMYFYKKESFIYPDVRYT